MSVLECESHPLGTEGPNRMLGREGVTTKLRRCDELHLLAQDILTIVDTPAMNTGVHIIFCFLQINIQKWKY